LRVFLLVSPPFVPPGEQDEWMLRSIDAALAAGAAVIALIPTRRGNGTIESLEADGLFVGPHLADLERSLALALARRRPTRVRIFADLWDIDRFASCPACLADRRRRLDVMNLEQTLLPPVTCAHCDGGPAR
jgi:hypothetical protein